MQEGIDEDVPVDVVDFDRAVVQVENVQPGVLLDELPRCLENVDGVCHVDRYDGDTRVLAHMLQFGLDSR